MKPVIKYQGGKSKELPLIKKIMPERFDRVVEPFCGGAAVSFGLGNNSVLSDINSDVINLYKTISDLVLYPRLQKLVDEIKGYDHDKLQEEYYKARDVINKGGDNFERALSYIILRQLCFSGMERYNLKGEFNVPFGHYKRFSCNLSPDHHSFLKRCEIKYQSFEVTLDRVKDDDFIFIDPPYLERLGYSKGDGGFELHSKLHSILSAVKAPWLIVHSDHEFYREYYKDYNIMDKDFNYSQIFGKGKNHSGAKVKHLYITNYD
jgi:DNA adenine methylase